MKNFNNKIKRGKKKLISIALGSSLLLSLSGCGLKPASKSGDLTPKELPMISNTLQPDENFTSSYSNLAVKLLMEDASSKIANGENVLISPESIAVAMAMAGTGANGTSKDEIYKLLACNMTPDEYNRTLSYIEQQMMNHGDTFHSANSVWIRDDKDRIAVKEEFTKNNKSYFNADSHLEPFNSETKNKINNWVSDSTKGMIPGIVNDIPADAIMYIINAIAFEGEWENPYEADDIMEGEIFTNGKGKEERANMLFSTEGIYIHNKNAKGVIKPYKGGDFAFMAILPNEGTDINTYLQNFTGDEFNELFNSKSYEDVTTRIPKFTYDYSTELAEPVAALGAPSIFDPSSADFTNIDSTHDIYVDQIIHKTHIELDENGTKAAAVTAITMVDGCAPLDEDDEPKFVILDRPFAYAIVDMQTGLPIFLGVVNTVE